MSRCGNRTKVRLHQAGPGGS
ncbi:hypothetical protein [Streptomyces sp. NRRL S-646]|nr:hypothetical protein [Streptomyces sp. NRRL S-646]